ncbi:MAG: methyltransferase domain-containing protein, partial [Ktedonobacteraceae bacterium]|nr:methyltransferase domain-containing protein [Ktedonobacteraceae bacterium]
PMPERNTYFIDPENGAEMGRLQHQDRMFTYGMGGLRPETDNDFSGIKYVLDIACGPGGWVLDLAQQQPEIEVVGVDISTVMIEYAQTHAQLKGLRNANFQLMSVLQPLNFEDNLFDLVNARFIMGFMPTGAWPGLLQECLRILKPGGCLRLTESEMAICNMPAVDQMARMMTYALHTSGYCFAPGGHQLGVTVMLGPLLRQAGCRDVKLHPYAIEYTRGSDLYDSFCENYRSAFQLARSFLIKTGAATPAEFELAYRQSLIEIQRSDFHGISYLLTAWGEKPG